MLVFIDESGDAGFKLSQGSTRFFVMVMVIFIDDLEAEKTALAIKELRREMGFTDRTEFKFNRSSRDVRIRFLEAVNRFHFDVRCLVADKSIVNDQKWRGGRDSFYDLAIESLLRSSGRTIQNARVKIDGSSERTFRRKFIAQLRQQSNSRQRKIIKNCKIVNSAGNVLIQMADMVAGSIRRSYDTARTDREIYRDIICKHIRSERLFRQ